MKECIEIDIAEIKVRLDKFGSHRAQDGYSWTCSRSTEKKFDLGVGDPTVPQPTESTLDDEASSATTEPSSFEDPFNAIASLGDFVLIRALTSEQRRKLNGCYGKVTASVNDDGRVTVTSFSDAEGSPIMFDQANAVRLKLNNVTVLQKHLDDNYCSSHLEDHYLFVYRTPLCLAVD